MKEPPRGQFELTVAQHTWSGLADKLWGFLKEDKAGGLMLVGLLLFVLLVLLGGTEAAPCIHTLS